MADRPLTRTEQRNTLAELERIGADVKRLRDAHPDSPLAGVNFQLASLVGQLQAVVASSPVVDDPQIREQLEQQLAGGNPEPAFIDGFIKRGRAAQAAVDAALQREVDDALEPHDPGARRRDRAPRHTPPPGAPHSIEGRDDA